MVPPLWRCRLRRHQVDRWAIAELDIRLPAVSEEHARRQVVLEGHRRAGVAPMKPLIAASMGFASARRLSA
jgi:hypothetical protein